MSYNKIIMKEIHFGDETIFPITVANLTEPVLEKVNRHFHSEMEILYLKKGKIFSEIDGEENFITTESIIIIPPNAVHSSYLTDLSILEGDLLIFDLSILESPVRDFCSNKYVLPIIKGEATFPTILENSNPIFNSVKEILLKISDIHNLSYEAYELDIKAAFLNLFSLLYRERVIHFKSTDKKEVKRKKNLNAIYTFIHDNYKKNISRQDILNLINVSETQFSRFFKKYSGFTFTEYLKLYRVHKSAYLLVNSDLTITEICFETGFDDLSYFIKVFKKNIGITPNKYRLLYWKDKKILK